MNEMSERMDPIAEQVLRVARCWYGEHKSTRAARTRRGGHTGEASRGHDEHTPHELTPCLSSEDIAPHHQSRQYTAAHEPIAKFFLASSRIHEESETCSNSSYHPCGWQLTPWR